jgi:type 1 fimbria pilin
MENGMKTVLIALLYMALPAFGADFSGVWKVTGSIAGNDVTPTCTFTQNSAKLTGTCKWDQDSAGVTGEVKDRQATWSYQVEYEGTEYTLTYTGTLGSDTSMKGSMVADPSDTEGEFTATRQ